MTFFFSPEIYIFDDIMSALDGKIGAFIYEQTILKQLKDKTVILVTHGLQYLKFADYIYVMDEGEIKQEGGFEDIRRTELYQKFQEIEQVSPKKSKILKKFKILIFESGAKRPKKRPKKPSKRILSTQLKTSSTQKPPKPPKN